MPTATAVNNANKADNTIHSMMLDLKRSNSISLNLSQATPMPSQQLIINSLSLEKGK